MFSIGTQVQVKSWANSEFHGRKGYVFAISADGYEVTVDFGHDVLSTVDAGDLELFDWWN